MTPWRAVQFHLQGTDFTDDNTSSLKPQPIAIHVVVSETRLRPPSLYIHTRVYSIVTRCPLGLTRVQSLHVNCKSLLFSATWGFSGLRSLSSVLNNLHSPPWKEATFPDRQWLYKTNLGVFFPPGVSPAYTVKISAWL